MVELEQRKDSDTRSSSDSSFDKSGVNLSEILQSESSLAAKYFKDYTLPKENQRVCALSTNYMSVSLYF